MDYATKSIQFGGNMEKLFLLNLCWLYLRLLWPSDLLQDNSDIYIDKCYILGTCMKENCLLNFPTQGKLSNYAWSLWKDFVYGAFCLIRKDGEGHVLLQLVGDRNVPSTLTVVTDDYTTIVDSISELTTLGQKFLNLPSHFKHIIGDITIPEDDGAMLMDAL
jgi:hypothetical protein